MDSPSAASVAAFKEYTSALFDVKMCHELAMEGGDDAEKEMNAQCHGRLYTVLEQILDSVNDDSNPPLDLELANCSVLVLIQEEEGRGEEERTLTLSTAPFPASEEHFDSKEALDTFFHYLTDAALCSDLELLALPKVHDRLSVAQRKPAKVVLRPWSATLRAHESPASQAGGRWVFSLEPDVVCVV
jgi:hypothetical protein